jgi:predicted restriction endonuclease
MIPPTITSESILHSIILIDRDGVPPNRQSRFYDLIVNERPYPPKYVISLASLYATGIEAQFDTFNAVEAKSYFIGHGYTIRDRRLQDNRTPEATDLANVPPDRVETHVYRILRDTAVARQVKILYDYRCQICGHTIRLKNDVLYAEAHHIRPLGNAHLGPDTRANILCVCPNHHAALDYGAEFLDIETLSVSEAHGIDRAFIEYHNEKIHGEEFKRRPAELGDMTAR